MTDMLRVAIIGGSDTARQLIVDFLSRSFIQVVSVVDLGDDSPGALVAQKAGIPFTTDIADLGRLDPRPDIVIDVCGRSHVNPALEETFPSSDPDGPAVVHDTIARLVLSLAADSAVLAPGCKPRLTVVAEA